MTPLRLRTEVYEKYYIPIILISSCIILNLFYIAIIIGLQYLAPVFPFLNRISGLSWQSSTSSMETASGAFTAVIFVGVIILEVFTNRYFPVVKYFFYHPTCLFIFTYSVSVSIFSYMSTFTFSIWPFAPFISFILLVLQNIILGLYFVFYIVNWISPNYTIQIIENDIKKIILMTRKIAAKKTISKKQQMNLYLKSKKEIFKLLTYIYAATKDKDRMVVNRAIFSISNVLKDCVHYKDILPEEFYFLTTREKDDRKLGYITKYIDIERDKFILEAKCFTVLDDIFQHLMSSEKQGTDQICTVLDEYAEWLIVSKQLTLTSLHMIIITYYRFIDRCLEYHEPMIASMLLERLYLLLSKFFNRIGLQMKNPSHTLKSYELIIELTIKVKNYSVLFYQKNMPDVLEKVANIFFRLLCDIINRDDPALAKLEDTILKIFLQVDLRPDPLETVDKSLLDVRVSQSLLGAFYETLSSNRNNKYHSKELIERNIKLIVSDISEEELKRIRAIKELTLQKVDNYELINKHCVNSFFSRFTINTLILSYDKRFDKIPLKSINLDRCTSIKQAIIKFSLKKYHLIIIDDVPEQMSYNELIYFMINFVPDDIKALIFAEFGSSQMKDNLYKFASLQIPFEIKFFNDSDSLNISMLKTQIERILYSNVKLIGDVKLHLNKLSHVFNKDQDFQFFFDNK